jgi:hypothetical protein
MDMRPISLFTKLGTRLFFQSSVVRFFYRFESVTPPEGCHFTSETRSFKRRHFWKMVDCEKSIGRYRPTRIGSSQLHRQDGSTDRFVASTANSDGVGNRRFLRCRRHQGKRGFLQIFVYSSVSLLKTIFALPSGPYMFVLASNESPSRSASW